MSPEPSLIWKTLRVPARILTSTLFDLKVYGKHHVPPDGGVLLVSNHQSFLDPIVLGAQLRRPMSFMAKSELFVNPAFGWLIRSLHAFPVRQGAGDKSAIEQTIRELQGGRMLNIFPEGTRTPDGTIQAMERGIVLVIRRAKVPVVPAAIDGTFTAWPTGKKLFRTGPVRVCFGPAMNLAELDRDRILCIVDRMLRGMFEALRKARQAGGGSVDADALDARIRQLSASLMSDSPANAQT